MNVQELLESELAKAKADVKRLEKEEQMAAYTLQKAHNVLVEAELRANELEDALELWVEQ
jgi:hypothetical protein